VRLRLKDYDIPTSLGPTAKSVDLFLSIEGIRQKEGAQGLAAYRGSL